MNTVEEIKTALEALLAAMSEKGILKPECEFRIDDARRLSIYLRCDRKDKSFGDWSIEIFYGKTAENCFEKAHALIAKLPDPDERVNREYLGKVADAIDFGTKHSIDDKYVSPLRKVTKAITDNLLPGPSK